MSEPRQTPTSAGGGRWPDQPAGDAGAQSPASPVFDEKPDPKLLVAAARAARREIESRHQHDQEIADRNDAIKAAFSGGHGFHAIARHVGLTPDRVRNIIQGRR